MTIAAKIILDSIASNGMRIITSELLYPRFIHSELLTHRVFSRSSASSRAIPTPKKIERIRKDCAKPSEWGINVKGMQSAGALDPELADLAEKVWLQARDSALTYAEALSGAICPLCFIDCGLSDHPRLDLHKQVSNRILEPFDHICTVVTTTKLNNHRKLRTEVDPLTGRPMPDPTYYELATKWHAALDASTPWQVPTVAEVTGTAIWHLPYLQVDIDGQRMIPEEDVKGIQSIGGSFLEIAKKVSVGRVARTSYMRSGEGDIKANIELHDRLSGAGHWSPFEPQATPIQGIVFRKFMEDDAHIDDDAQCDYCQELQQIGDKCVELQDEYGECSVVCKKCALGHVTSGNFVGWRQYRKEFSGEAGGDD